MDEKVPEEVAVYLIKSTLLIVRLDPEEMNQGVKLLHAVHHRRPCQTEAVNGLQETACAGRDSDAVLDALRLVEDNAVEFAHRPKEWKLLFHRTLVECNPLSILLFHLV